MKDWLDPNDPLAGIENRLRQLDPALPPKELASALDAAEPGARKVIVHHPWFWISLAAAASIVTAVLFTMNDGGDGNQPQPLAVVSESAVSPDSLRIYAPVSTRNLLINAREVGVIETKNAPPVRLIRCLWLDDATYRSSGEHPDLQVTRTREQIIPVAFEVY